MTKLACLVPGCARAPIIDAAPAEAQGYLATAGPQLEARKRLDNAQAEFAKAGLSAAASNRVLKQCKVYLQWDCESNLQPALQLWLQEFGSEKLHEVL